jgi:hypothetical protein
MQRKASVSVPKVVDARDVEKRDGLRRQLFGNVMLAALARLQGQRQQLVRSFAQFVIGHGLDELGPQTRIATGRQDVACSTRHAIRAIVMPKQDWQNSHKPTLREETP